MPAYERRPLVAACAVAPAGPRAAGPPAMLYVTHLGNAGLHLGWAVRHRRYDPGAGLVPALKRRLG